MSGVFSTESPLFFPFFPLIFSLFRSRRFFSVSKDLALTTPTLSCRNRSPAFGRGVAFPSLSSFLVFPTEDFLAVQVTLPPLLSSPHKDGIPPSTKKRPIMGPSYTFFFHDLMSPLFEGVIDGPKLP